MKMKEIHRSFTLSSQNGANFAGEKTKTRSLKEINSIYYITMSYLRFTKMFLLILACVMGGLSANAQKTVEDLINQEATGVTGTTYKDVTVNGTSGAVYAIQCAGDKGSVQLRSKKDKKDKHSGIVTTKTGGKAKKITVNWNDFQSSAKERLLDIYGSNDAYTSPNDLFNSTNKPIGQLSYTTGDENVKSFVIEGDYAFIGLRSNDGAIYLNSITITWEQEGGATEEVTVNLADGFGTLYNANALTVPAGASCGIVTGVKNGVLDVDYKYAAGQNVPAKTPVLVKAPGKESVTFTTTTSTETAPTDNLLKGADKDGEFATETDNYYYYKLAYDNFTAKTGLGFYWGAANGGAFTMKAGKAYLAVEKTVAQGAQKFSLEGNATGIEAVEQANEANRVVYTLDGRRVMNEKLAKGLYIINGKKVLVK